MELYLDIDSKQTVAHEILPNLIYLGDKKSCCKTVIERYKITHTICIIDKPSIKHKVHTKNNLAFHFRDVEYCQELESHISKANAFIDDAIKNKGRILVHCTAGVSRSASIVIAYLMSKHDITYEKAYEFVKSKRKQARPADVFVTCLKSLSS